MDIKQRDYEIGVRGVDLLVNGVSQVSMAGTEVSSRESRCEGSL